MDSGGDQRAELPSGVELIGRHGARDVVGHVQVTTVGIDAHVAGRDAVARDPVDHVQPTRCSVQPERNHSTAGFAVEALATGTSLADADYSVER